LAHGPLNREELQDLLEALRAPQKLAPRILTEGCGGDDWKDPIFWGGWNEPGWFGAMHLPSFVLL